MEVNFVDGDVVNLGFGLTQALKHCGGGLFNGSRERGRIDQFQDVFQMPVSGCVPADNSKFRSGYAAALCFLDRKLGSRAQAFEREHDRARICAGVDQCADRHISADARESIQVADFHAINWGNSSPDGPWRNSSMLSESTVSAMLISTTRAPDAFAIWARPAAG